MGTTVLSTFQRACWNCVVPAGSAQPPGEALAQPDPVLEHLLRKARSPEVREQFLLIPSENYTAQHQVKILVSP